MPLFGGLLGLCLAGDWPACRRRCGEQPFWPPSGSKQGLSGTGTLACIIGLSGGALPQDRGLQGMACPHWGTFGALESGGPLSCLSPPRPNSRHCPPVCFPPVVSQFPHLSSAPHRGGGVFKTCLWTLPACPVFIEGASKWRRAPSPPSHCVSLQQQTIKFLTVLAKC